MSKQTLAGLLAVAISSAAHGQSLSNYNVLTFGTNLTGEKIISECSIDNILGDSDFSELEFEPHIAHDFLCRVWTRKAVFGMPEIKYVSVSNGYLDHLHIFLFKDNKLISEFVQTGGNDSNVYIERRNSLDIAISEISDLKKIRQQPVSEVYMIPKAEIGESDSSGMKSPRFTTGYFINNILRRNEPKY